MNHTPSHCSFKIRNAEGNYGARMNVVTSAAVVSIEQSLCTLWVKGTFNHSLFCLLWIQVKQRGHADTQHCVTLCLPVRNNKKRARRLNFWGAIACCDHEMSSASSLSRYQAVCCTELLSCSPQRWPHSHSLPLALSHSPPSLCLSCTRVQWPSPPRLPRPPEALSFHSVSAEASVLTKQRAFRRHIRTPPPPLCAVSELSA